MRKLIGIAAVLALLSFVCSAEAAVGYNKDGEYKGTASNIDVKKGFSTFDGRTVSIYASGYKGGTTDNVSGESNLTSAALAYGVIRLADTGALDNANCRYISLANGTPGQMVTIQLVAATAGTLYITDDKVGAGAMTKTGWDDIALGTALDTVTLLYLDDTVGWIIVGEYGCVVT